MPSPESDNPKVFVSYSQDSPEHDERVLQFANRLRDQGIDAALDQYETFPPQGWISWMKRQVLDSQFVLIVCTETYLRRADGEEDPGVGRGAVYESQLIEQLLYNTGGVNKKFVPVVLTEGDREHIPIQLQKYNYYQAHTGDGYEDLYRLLTDQARIQEPTLGRLQILRSLPVREGKRDFRNIAWKVLPKNPFFTGREEFVERLRRTLTRDSPTDLPQPKAINGLGGIGKTQAAVEYAYRYREEYRVVLWISADSRDALVSGFASLASLLQLAGSEQNDLVHVVAVSKRWLESNRGWLLILDNVEDLSVTSEFIPSNYAGHVVMTTRLHAMGTIAERVELKKMESIEGSLFLLRRAKIIGGDVPLGSASELDQALAAEICEELGGLPLALDQAGAFIEETPSNLAEYLGLYRAEGKKLRAERGDLARDHPSVTVTFSLAFEQVSQNSAAAGDLVRLCSFLAGDAIPEELFLESGEHLSEELGRAVATPLKFARVVKEAARFPFVRLVRLCPFLESYAIPGELFLEGGEHLGEELGRAVAKPLEFARVVKEAARFSLVRRNPADKMLGMHRLVQSVVRDEMDAETRRLWAARAVRAVSKAFPRADHNNWLRCERLRSHGLAGAKLIEQWDFDFGDAVKLLVRTSAYLFNRGSFAEVEPLYERALAIRERAMGPKHRCTASSLNSLATLYRVQGRYEEAEPLFKRALAIWEKALGPEHPDSAKSLSNLATLYRVKGRYEEAEPLFKRALDRLEKSRGPEHPDTAHSLNNLGAIYSIQGRYEEAEALFKRALDIWEKALGREHRDTANSLNSLATLYSAQGRYEEAEPLYERTVAIWEKSWGPEHPGTAVSLNNLAGVYRIQGRYKEAEPLIKRALAIREKSLGPEHPGTAHSLNSLAKLYLAEGRYEEAEPIVKRALAIREKSLGPAHADTAASLSSLATLYLAEGRYEEAEQLFKHALSIREKSLGPEHPHTANSLNGLAKNHRGQGRYQEAQMLFKRVLAIREKVLGPEHPDTTAVSEDYATLLRATGRDAEGAQLESQANPGSCPRSP